MAGTHNFQIWDQILANALSDAAYTSNTQRQNGAAIGDIFPSQTGNKLFLQVSIMAYALAQAMAAKNYTLSDSNAGNLSTVMQNILTNNDVPGKLVQFSDFTQSVAFDGWMKLPSGLIIMWGKSNPVAGTANSNSVDVTFISDVGINFSTNCFMALATAGDVSPGSHGATVCHVTAKSTTKITITMVNADANNHVGAVGAYWLAIGY